MRWRSHRRSQDKATAPAGSESPSSGIRSEFAEWRRQMASNKRAKRAVRQRTRATPVFPRNIILQRTKTPSPFADECVRM
jgi:hypothetical protein